MTLILSVFTHLYHTISGDSLIMLLFSQLASRNGFHEVVRLLVEKGGADVQERNATTGWVALHEAAFRGHTECVKVYINLVCVCACACVCVCVCVFVPPLLDRTSSDSEKKIEQGGLGMC